MLLTTLWSYDKCTTLTPYNTKLALVRPMSIICLTRSLSLIDIDGIWLLSLVYLLMRILTSFLRYTGYQKHHKRPYKSRFIANSSSCTTTELSIMLTYCLTAIKNYVIKYCETVFEENGKSLFWS